MKNNLHLFLLTFLVVLFLNNKVNSQCLINYLNNPSFELPVQPLIGNNFPVTATGWTVVGGPANLIKTNGTDYLGGPNNASNGLQYLDIVNAGGTVEQSFTTTCASVVNFSGDFSSRESGANWTAKIDILNSANVVVATSTTRNFTPADADLALPGGPDAVWYKMSGTSLTLPAGTYKFRAELDNFSNFDNAFLCIEPGCLLPVRLNEFNILAENCKPILQWKTSNEINFKHFEIEESINGLNFNKVATINAQGLLGETVYSFKDDLDNNPNTFYRLKMVDNDGQYKYSDILKFVNSCGKQSNLEIYPNPLVNTMFVNYFDAKSPTGKLKIINSNGAVLKEVIIKNGSSSVDVSSFAKGLYIVTVSGSNVHASIKIVKQ